MDATVAKRCGSNKFNFKYYPVMTKNQDSANNTFDMSSMLDGPMIRTISKDSYAIKALRGQDGKDHQVLCQRDFPRMVVQVFTFDTPEAFHKAVKMLAEQKRMVAYYPGREDYCCIQAGCMDNLPVEKYGTTYCINLLQNALKGAAVWWHIYGKRAE